MRTPRPSEILVRFLYSEAIAEGKASELAWRWLDSEERRAWTRLRGVRARRDYLAAHALARATLAELAGVQADALCIRKSPQGRPAIIAPAVARDLRFSLAGADGVALCAVARNATVGADVESVENLEQDPLAVAGIICADCELRALRALPPSARAEQLAFLWTAKEAAAKAVGLGFGLSMERVVEGVAGKDRCWHLASLRLGPRHLASIAAFDRRRPAPARFEEVALQPPPQPCVARLVALAPFDRALCWASRRPDPGPGCRPTPAAP